MSYLERTDTFIASLGVEAYRVGGSVRDEVLGRPAKDADYVIRGVPLAELGEALKSAARTYARADSRRGSFAVKPLVLRDGRQAGWRVSAKGLGCIEIVLPRTEISTGPGHRDFKIILNPYLPLTEDAKRRDFTFNALYRRIGDLDRNVELVDPTGRGIYDLERKQINVTHADSFRDDPLRMLRALRFVSTLGYDLGPETRALMALHAENVLGLWSKAKPRTDQITKFDGAVIQKKRIPGDHGAKAHISGTVLSEFSKLLMGQDPAKALRLARDTGVLAVAIPELKPMLGFDQGSRYHDMTTDEHTFVALETAAHVDAPLRVRWALLFHDSGKPETVWIDSDGRKHYYEPSDKIWAALTAAEGENLGLEDFERAEGPPPKPRDHELVSADLWRTAAVGLQTDKRLRDDVGTLIRNHMVPTQKVNPVKVRRMRIKLGDDLLRDLYLMRLCDLSGKGKKNLQFLENVANMEKERARCQDAGVPCKTDELAIDGHDVREQGIEGREIGRVLSAVLDEVACDPSELKLSREWQLGRIKAV